MSEWPDAPRLRSALGHLADQADVGPEARRTMAAELNDANARLVSVPLAADVDGAADTGLPVARRRVGWILTVAAASIVAIIVASSIGERGDDADDVATTAPGLVAATALPAATPAATPFTAAVPPHFDPGIHCVDQFPSPVAFRIDVDEVPLDIGVTSAGGGGPDIVVLTPRSGWESTAAALRVGEGRDRFWVYYIPTPADAPAGTALMPVLRSSVCARSVYLIATATALSAGLSMACDSDAGFRVQGLVLEAPALPPDECVLGRPTILLGSEPLEEQGAWEAMFGCGVPVIQTDQVGNVITSYEDCTNTLIHVDTVAEDPWSATIDGVPAADFALRVTEHAG